MHFNAVQSSAMTVLSFPIPDFFNAVAYSRPAVGAFASVCCPRTLGKSCAAHKAHL